jgi:hypothetical protein
VPAFAVTRRRGGATAWWRDGVVARRRGGVVAWWRDANRWWSNRPRVG